MRKVAEAFSTASLLLRNLAWLCLSEAANRVTRILTIVVVARLLSPGEFGAAAIALATFELLRAFACNGIAAFVIRAPEETLARTCDTAWRLNWIVGGALAAVNVLIAWPIALAYDSAVVGPLLLTLAVGHLLYPITTIHVCLVQRAGRLGLTARASGGAAVVENLLTAGMAFAGAGVWALVVPRLAAAATWVIVHRCGVRWRPTPGADLGDWRPFVAFGRHVLGSDPWHICVRLECRRRPRRHHFQRGEHRGSATFLR